MFKVFYNQVRFEKKIGSFSLKMQLKRRREEEIWITKRTLWCYSQVYLSQKKERSRTKTIFKASNDPVSKVKVWILTQIEGRIQENVRIFFLTSDRFDRWLNMYSFFLPPMLICRHKDILWENWIFFSFLTMSFNRKPTTYPNDRKAKIHFRF